MSNRVIPPSRIERSDEKAYHYIYNPWRFEEKFRVWNRTSKRVRIVAFKMRTMNAHPAVLTHKPGEVSCYIAYRVPEIGRFQALCSDHITDFRVDYGAER